ncbi:hypothetical protein AVEN_261650-1 [Araneus ventricosus]|uniref:Uncharacterized protein n=1 Tax=Araneus ventricosus TaxID=182803 RepID=A0A4Y2HWI9_ARAVE|nr:hypothetical protein AVEN_261650-1 [Araneus ventricosus]
MSSFLLFRLYCFHILKVKSRCPSGKVSASEDFRARNPIPLKIRRVLDLLTAKSYVGDQIFSLVVRKLGEGDVRSVKQKGGVKDKKELSKLRFLCRSLAAITPPTMGQRAAICQDNRSNDTSLSARSTKEERHTGETAAFATD